MKWTTTPGSTDKIYLFNDTVIDDALKIAQSRWTGAVIQTNSSTLEIYIGISYVSVENAKMNLEMEVGNKLFDTLKAENQAVWAK